MKPPISVEESKVLFALLDAADDEGLLRNSNVEERWREAKSRLTGSHYEAESALLWELLHEVERSRVIENSWIQDRWRTVKKQVERAMVLAKRPVDPGSSNSPSIFARLYRG